MTIYIKDSITYFTNPDPDPTIDQIEIVQSRKADILTHRQAQIRLSPEQLIQSGEEAEKLLFG